MKIRYAVIAAVLACATPTTAAWFDDQGREIT
jgi:hypothetical protein